MAPEVEKLKQELQEKKYADLEKELEKMIDEDNPEYRQMVEAPDNVNLEA